MLGALAVGAYAASLVARTPDAFALAEATQAQPSVVLAASGERLTQFEPAFQEWVPLDSIPGPLVDALIDTEDRRFYEHGGVDLYRTAGALWATARGRREGGSTVTQQLARNLFPAEIGRVSTAERKVKEMIAAVRIEQNHTKREILESYLNTVPFLYNAHGVEMAARTYFGTHAPDLTVAQAATLVAMLKGPSEYNPVRRPEAALRRRNLVLQLMEQQGDLTLAEAAEARQSPLGVTLREQPGTYSAAPHFTAAVRKAVEAWATPRGYDVERDGLVIRTTLEMSAQRAAEAAVTERATRLQATANREWRSGPPRRTGTARPPARVRTRWPWRRPPRWAEGRMAAEHWVWALGYWAKAPAHSGSGSVASGSTDPAPVGSDSAQDCSVRAQDYSATATAPAPPAASPANPGTPARAPPTAL